MYVGPLFWAGGEFFAGHLLSDLAHQAHLVKGQLVLPGSALHDGSQERLRVEEAGQPDGDGEAEVRGPALQLTDPEQEVGVPGGQAVQGGVGQLHPGRRNLVEGIFELILLSATWSKKSEFERSSMSDVVVSSPLRPRSSSLRLLFISCVRLFIRSHSWTGGRAVSEVRERVLPGSTQ